MTVLSYKAKVNRTKRALDRVHISRDELKNAQEGFLFISYSILWLPYEVNH